MTISSRNSLRDGWYLLQSGMGMSLGSGMSLVLRPPWVVAYCTGRPRERGAVSSIVCSEGEDVLAVLHGGLSYRPALPLTGRCRRCSTLCYGGNRHNQLWQDQMSPKHLDRYVTEFAGCHNERRRDTQEQMA